MNLNTHLKNTLFHPHAHKDAKEQSTGEYIELLPVFLRSPSSSLFTSQAFNYLACTWKGACMSGDLNTDLNKAKQTLLKLLGTLLWSRDSEYNNPSYCVDTVETLLIHNLYANKSWDKCTTVSCFNICLFFQVDHFKGRNQICRCHQQASHRN